MAWRSPISRSLATTARSSTLRLSQATTALPRVRLPLTAAPRLQRSYLSFASTRSFGELGCVQSLLPIHTSAMAPRLTSHLSVTRERAVSFLRVSNMHRRTLEGAGAQRWLHMSWSSVLSFSLF